MKYYNKLQKIVNLYYQEKMPDIKSVHISGDVMMINFVNYRIRAIWKYNKRFWEIFDNLRGV